MNLNKEVSETEATIFICYVHNVSVMQKMSTIFT